MRVSALSSFPLSLQCQLAFIILAFGIYHWNNSSSGDNKEEKEKVPITLDNFLSNE
jgi:hypothetical protein